MILWEYRGSLQAVFVIALTIVSWRHGAAPEKATSATLAMMVTAAWIYRHLGLPLLPGRVFDGYTETTPFFLLIDGVALLALLMIAFRANRVYPIWAAGFQLTAMFAHFVNAIDLKSAPFAYAAINIIPFYFVIISQALGLVFHIRRRILWGPYPSWRSSSVHLPEMMRN